MDPKIRNFLKISKKQFQSIYHGFITECDCNLELRATANFQLLLGF